MDLDKFKPLNDTHGYVVGDLLLLEVGRRISSCIRETDTVARFGGDEFVVMLGELNADGRINKFWVEKDRLVSTGVETSGKDSINSWLKFVTG